MEKNNIFGILLKDDNVNAYAKVLILISQLNYYNRYDIPNLLIMRRLKLSKQTSIRIINKLKNNGIIKVWYIGTKRKIKLSSYDYIANFEPFNDDWLI